MIKPGCLLPDPKADANRARLKTRFQQLMQYETANMKCAEWTIAQHRKPDLWWSLTWVRGGSTLLNLIEPLSSKRKNNHRIILMSLGWFNSSKPVRTIIEHMEPGMGWSLRWGRGSSTWPNQQETEAYPQLMAKKLTTCALPPLQSAGVGHY